MHTSHTPGPWRVQGCGIVSMNDNIAHVARLPGEENHPSVLAERKANARLIASAPEMLAALDIMVRAANVSDIDPLVMFAAIERARAAIAKATGA